MVAVDALLTWTVRPPCLVLLFVILSQTTLVCRHVLVNQSPTLRLGSPLPVPSKTYSVFPRFWSEIKRRPLRRTSRSRLLPVKRTPRSGRSNSNSKRPNIITTHDKHNNNVIANRSSNNNSSRWLVAERTPPSCRRRRRPSVTR